MNNRNKVTQDNQKHPRYGMVVDLDKCTGCGTCSLACAVENNQQPATPDMTNRTGNTWMRMYKVHNGKPFPDSRAVFVPMFCQQCDDTPCLYVCPQNAVELDPMTGIVAQIPERCFGCRYCMAACPYESRYFNWWDPVWPEGMEKTLNPDVSPRMRGVVEKCNFCHGRWQRARAKAASEGRRELREDEYIPACVECCPTDALTFGNLDDPKSKIAKLVDDPNTFKILGRLGTKPKVYYRTTRSWVRNAVDRNIYSETKETVHG